MPVKLTWKSLGGVLAVVAGIVTSAAHSGLPASVSTVLVAIGGVIVAVERYADAQDYATDQGVKQTVVVPGGAPPQGSPTTPTAPPGPRTVTIDGEQFQATPNGNFVKVTP